MVIDSEDVAQSLRGAVGKLDGAKDTVLDLSRVGRLDAAGLRALEELAGAAAAGSAKVVLRGVRVDVYRVLKLARLAARFDFAD